MQSGLKGAAGRNFVQAASNKCLFHKNYARFWMIFLKILPRFSKFSQKNPVFGHND
jgi:hypothetical protein